MSSGAARRTEMPVEWLLEGEPFVAYRARLDLLGEREGAAEVRAARAAMLADARVVGLVDDLRGWPGVVISSHKSAGQPFHKLSFLADLGLRRGDPGIDEIASAVMARTSEEGPFALPINVAASHGGTGSDVWAWALCDAPLLVYSLAALGLTADARVRRAAEYLAALVRDSGWPCVVSRELGSFRGPGRKDDPCPFATLAMLKALSQFDDLRESPAAHAGAEALLCLWDQSRTRHPYMFFMGTDFRKLKAPFVWYDLLHVLDVLSRYPWLRADPRFLDMAGTLRAQADEQGRFTAESVWLPWNAWEFGQKRTPSRWVTFLAWRCLQRSALV